MTCWKCSAEYGTRLLGTDRDPCRMNDKLLRGAILLVAAVALGWAAGCEVGPNYSPPRQPMPRSWVAPPTTQASIIVQQPIEIARWWTTFNDPELNSLIGRAVAANLD